MIVDARISPPLGPSPMFPWESAPVCRACELRVFTWDAHAHTHTLWREQFGEFKLKSGIMSPVYFDLRVTVSYPKILKQISDQLWEISKDGTFDVMCGLCTLPVSARARLSVDMRSKHACPYPPSQHILLCTTSGDSLKYCKLPEPIEIRPGPVHLGHRCELYAFPPMKSE